MIRRSIRMKKTVTVQKRVGLKPAQSVRPHLELKKILTSNVYQPNSSLRWQLTV